MNKYALDDSNLAVEDFNDPAKIKPWVDGVWGRITHQLSESGWPYDNQKVMALAGKYFYDQVSDHKFYDKLKPHLPRAVTMYDLSEE